MPSPHAVARFEESQDGQIIQAASPSDHLGVAGRTASWKSQLSGIAAQLLPGFESASPTGQELEPNFDSHHYLSMVIYLLSNGLVRDTFSLDSEVTMSDVLQMTFTFVSRQLLVAVLHNHLPSIKAAWEELLIGAQELENKEAFKFLISVGMNNDWLDEHHRGHEYLFSAAQMNCLDILCDLIDKGCHADSYPIRCSTGSIIVDVLENGNFDCARLLIENCDVNHETRQGRSSFTSTHFVDFIFAFNDTRSDHLHCLELFFKQGADVDYEFHPRLRLCGPLLRMLRYRNRAEAFRLTDDWPLSILDYVYYFHRSCFAKLARYSKVPLGFSRARVLWHLDQGVDALREYLPSNLDFPRPFKLGETAGNDTNKADIPERRHHCLEMLLAEQFLLSIDCPEDNEWWNRVKGLSELGIDLTWLSNTKELAGSILYATAFLITSDDGTEKENGSQIMHWLLDQGFQVKADALCVAIDDDEGGILEYLASVCKDLEEEAGEALVHAALDDNFDAIKRLLDKGVDPNFITARDYNAFEAAARGSSLATMKYLVQRGARPRTWTQADHPSRALMKMFAYHAVTLTDEMFNKVEYITEKHITIDEPSCPSAQLLEMCHSLPAFREDIEQRRVIFEFLLKKGARLSPGSPLAEWIAAGGGHQLVQEMLDAGADPDAYSSDTDSRYPDIPRTIHTPLQAAAWLGDHTLVCMLMERGADVNRPAVGVYGRTALQAICAWDPVRSEERVRKDKIIRSLLDEGAEVNGTSSQGHTALIHAAQLGDMSTAFTLLKHGAKVDVISTQYNHYTGHHSTALDVAAYFGRLDMVEFLLNANALSSSAYFDSKDYDLAIQSAREQDNFAVSEVIRKHSADRKRWDVPHRQKVETSFPPKHIPQSLSLRANSGTATWPQSERRATSSENLQDVTVLAQTHGLSYAFDGCEAERGTAASKAQDNGTSEAEATDASWPRVIEEIEDEPPVANAGCDVSIGEESDGTDDQALDSGEASSGLEGWLYRPKEQIWVEDEQQNIDLLVSSSLSTDVFMGFSEFSSP